MIAVDPASQFETYTFELSAAAATKTRNRVVTGSQIAGTAASEITVPVRVPLEAFTTVTCELTLEPFTVALAT
jgi:hypothetical protein